MVNNGLGRGLSSLIPPKINKIISENEDGTSDANIDQDRILQISPDQITVNPFQPRQDFSSQLIDELVDSIRQYGIIQPLIVSKSKGGSGSKYELIAGERRLRAAKAIGLDKVPVITRDAHRQEKLEVALIENIQRKDLNPIEQALAFNRLIDEFNLSQDEVAKRVGKARSSVANILRLLNLPEEIQQALKENRITQAHCKILIGLDSEDKQTALFKKIMRNNLSVDRVFKEARRMGGTKAARIKINYADKDKEFAFREFFKTKVEVKRKGKGGQVIIDFYSEDELADMVGKISEL